MYMYIKSTVHVPMGFEIIDHHCLTFLTFMQKTNASNIRNSASLAISIYFIMLKRHLIYRDLFLRYSIYPIQTYRRVEDDNRVKKK
jgi:hypothetical protein